jgi:hypothetical protein
MHKNISTAVASDGCLLYFSAVITANIVNSCSALRSVHPPVRPSVRVVVQAPEPLAQTRRHIQDLNLHIMFKINDFR